MKSGQSQRLFVGIALPASVQRDLQAALAEGPTWPGRVVDPLDWHITVVFLGATTTAQQEALIERLGETDLGRSFELTTGCLGAFPDARHARIGWLGLSDGSEALSRLNLVVSPLCAGLGFSLDQRPYTPHLTLTRISPPRSVESLVEGFVPRPVTFGVAGLTLFDSAGRGDKGRYTPIETFPFRR